MSWKEMNIMNVYWKSNEYAIFEKMEKKLTIDILFSVGIILWPLCGANPSTTKHYYKEVSTVYLHERLPYWLLYVWWSRRKDKSYLISYAFTLYSAIRLFHILIISHDTYIPLVLQLYIVEILSFQG